MGSGSCHSELGWSSKDWSCTYMQSNTREINSKHWIELNTSGGCWYFLTLTEKSTSAWKYRCNRLLTSLPRGRERRVTFRYYGRLREEMLKRDKLGSHPLASGTGILLVCQEYPAISSIPNPHVGDYKGRTGLSPPAAYPDRPCRWYANKGNL